MRRKGRLLAGLALVASLLPTAQAVFAQGTFVLLNDRNHPELRWLEIRSDHFRIFYHDPLEDWARDAASILERYHEPLCRRLDTRPREKVRVYLSDQDQIANGAAIGWEYFYVWIPSHASHRSFAGDRSWFEEVLIHEYTHILISEASRTWLGNFAFLLGFYPPRWLHEGIAQWTAERWSVMRGDRTLSAAVLDGSIDRNPPGVPGRGHLLHYVRGHARVRWLAEAFGDSTIPKLIQPHGTFGRYSFPAAFGKALGKNGKEAVNRFRREMIAFYGERFRRGEPADSIGPIYDVGLAYPSHVALGPDSLLWIVGQQRRGARESSLFRKDGNGPAVRVIPGAVSGRPVPLDDGRVIVARYHRVESGSWGRDLAIWDPTSGTRFLTSGARIGEVARAGESLLALTDSPFGPSLLRSPLPERDDPGSFRSLYPWPRGWVVHGLASSPDGLRLAFAATEPDGKKGLWGMRGGPTVGRPIRLSDSGEARDGTWIDGETISWTSHADGLEQIRTLRWLETRAVGPESIRTAAATGIAVAGSGNDSLFALDHTSRLRVPVRRVDPARRPIRSISGPVYPFDPRPATRPSSSRPRITGPYPYRPLDEVRTWLVLPLLGPQAGEPAIGFAGIWAEPLLRHAWGGYIYGNTDQVRHPDRELFYLTTRWGPWVAAFHSSALQPRRVLDDRILFERRETSGIAWISPLHLQSDPILSAWVDGFVKTDSRRPRFGGRALSTPLGQPRAWSSLRIGGGIGALRIPAHARGATGPRAGWGASLRMQGGLAPWPGATRFFRGGFHAFRAGRLSVPFGPTLWTEFRFEGSSNDLPPQEFIGLDGDASHRLLSGWPGLDGTIFLRGWPRARAARYVAGLNLEARFRVLPDLGIRGPGVGIFGGSLAPFLEIAHPWGGRSAGLLEERTRSAVGLEARLAARVGIFPVVPSVAWGEGVGRDAPKGSWSWRIATSVPFSMPLRPPAILRALHGGALLTEEDSDPPGRAACGAGVAN